MRNQIGKYSAAVGKRNVGSDPGAARMARTRNVAIGTDRAITTKVRRGSWEGYSNGSSTHIALSGRGYLAEANQVARNRNKLSRSLTPQHRGPSPNPISGVGFINHNFHDYSMLGANGSSIRRVRKLMELDRSI